MEAQIPQDAPDTLERRNLGAPETFLDGAGRQRSIQFVFVRDPQNNTAIVRAEQIGNTVDDKGTKIRLGDVATLNVNAIAASVDNPDDPQDIEDVVDAMRIRLKNGVEPSA